MGRLSKRPIILMELLVALVLIGTILSLLLRFFNNTLKMDQKIDSLRKEALVREHMQVRLLHFFTAILPRSSLPNLTHATLYSIKKKNGGIEAIFDNGIDPDPAFSGAIIGKVYLDSKKRLFFSLHPLDPALSDECRKELLLQHVDELQFQFLSKKNDEEQKFQWIPIWEKDRWDAPSIVRMFIKRGGQDLPFAFTLPFADPITYEKGKS